MSVLSAFGIPDIETAVEVDPSGQIERTLFKHRKLAEVMEQWSGNFPPKASDVRSDCFHELMHRYVYAPPDFNEARDRTDSYRFRHDADMRAVLGVWRWRGLYDHRELLLPILENAKSILDHGGGACPLEFGADVVESDAELAACEGPYDVVFSSHTLEHCKNVSATIAKFTELLRHGGYLILHVPAYTAPHWNAGTVRENDAIHGPHLWNFCLASDWSKCPAPQFTIDDDAFLMTKYVGDNSILVVASKA